MSAKKVNITLSGSDLKKHADLQRKFLIENDAEIFRMAIRWFHRYYDIISELGIDEDLSVEDIKQQIESINKRLKSLEKKLL